LGIGLNFYQFSTSHGEFGEHMITKQKGTFRIADRITYIGPAFALQMALGENFLFNADFSIGYIEQYSKVTFLKQKETTSGSTVGFHTKVGLSYKLSPQIAIGFELLTTEGVIFEYTATDINGQKTKIKLEENKGESLSQISISLGLRYYINRK